MVQSQLASAWVLEIAERPAAEILAVRGEAATHEQRGPPSFLI